MQPLEISTIRANQINDVSKHAAILSDLKTSIIQAIDSPSFNQLIAGGANVKETRRVLAVLISKYANMLTVGGNLRPEHPMQYAESIMQDYPGMSLDDFNIILGNGVKGRYNDHGKLFRFDISVIYDWIRSYQDQYLDVQESQPMHKSALDMLPDEKILELQDVILKSDGVKPVRAMTESEILEEGREKLIKHIGKNMTISEYRDYTKQKNDYKPMTELEKRNWKLNMELKVRFNSECFNKLGQHIEGRPETFEEWIKFSK